MCTATISRCGSTVKWSGVVQEASSVTSLLHIIHVLSLIVRPLGKSPPDNKLGLLFLFEFKLFISK